ncbi:MAG: YihY/virulence factor BrkB family protein [Bacteroidota bacterium]
MLLQPLRNLWQFLYDTVIGFNEKKGFKHGAAIAYYTLFSLPGILIVVITLAGAFVGESQVQTEILVQIESNFGTDTALQVQQIIENIQLNDDSWVATILGIASLLFGASGVFYTLQDSLNSMWELPSKLAPSTGGGILKLVVDRILSFAMVLSLGFILLVSMLLDTLLVAMTSLLKEVESQVLDRLTSWQPWLFEWIEHVDWYFWLIYSLDFAIGLAVMTLLFSAIFRYLPSARIAWRDALGGAFVTALLFSAGKAGFSWYIGNSSISSSYGAAGSVVMLLLWVYFSAQILLLGAKGIHVHLQRKGQDIEPATFFSNLTDHPFSKLSKWFKRWRNTSDTDASSKTES